MNDKIIWPDISFPPINLWCLMSAYDFYNTDTISLEDYEDDE